MDVKKGNDHLDAHSTQQILHDSDQNTHILLTHFDEDLIILQPIIILWPIIYIFQIVIREWHEQTLISYIWMYILAQER